MIAFAVDTTARVLGVEASSECFAYLGLDILREIGARKLIRTRCHVWRLRISAAIRVCALDHSRAKGLPTRWRR